MVQWVRKEKRLIWPCCPVPLRSPGVRKWHKPSSTKCLLLLPVTTVDVLESHINIWSFSIAVWFWAVPVSRNNEFQSVIVCCVNKALFPWICSVNMWRNSCCICWCCTCPVDRELQPAQLGEGGHLGTSSKWTQSLKITWRKILSTALGRAAVRKE